MEDPAALKELAKLLSNGFGVVKDIARAQELHSRPWSTSPI
jgi:hypothetical protein